MLTVDLSFFIAKLCIQQQRLGCEKNKQCYAIIGCGRRCFVNIRLDLPSDLLQGQIFSKLSGMGEETYDLEGGGGEGEMAFSDKIVRRGFIKKVYSIISVQVEKQTCVLVVDIFQPVQDTGQGSDMDRREILCEKWQLTDFSTKLPKSRQYLTTTLR